MAAWFAFEGRFDLDKPLDEDTYRLLFGLSKTRRMKRDPAVLEALGFGKAESFGVDGEFFYNEQNFADLGQTRDPSIIEYNRPPRTQPALCNWKPTEDRLHLQWNGQEKFYHPTEWMKYLIRTVLGPRGYMVNGAVQVVSQHGDWQIVIRDNQVIEEKQQAGPVML